MLNRAQIFVQSKKQTKNEGRFERVNGECLNSGDKLVTNSIQNKFKKTLVAEPFQLN